MGLGKSNADFEDQVTDRHDSWESDVPSSTANPARLVVGIAGACGLMACMLLLWHFAFAQPVPVAPATATFVTQPPVQPVVPIQPVTSVPVTPQPPTTSVTPPAQASPPKPVAKDGREPIDYQPIYLQAWQKKNLTPKFYPWEGEKVVLLTTTAGLDPKTINLFLKRLDEAWTLCGELTGYVPQPYKQYRGKPTIAAIPDPTLTFGKSYGVMAMGGGEVSTFDGPQGDYERVRQSPDQFSTHIFQVLAQNHYGYSQSCLAYHEGSMMVLREICLESVKLSEADAKTRRSLEQVADAYAKSNLSIATSFPNLTGSRPMELKDSAGQPLPPTTIGALLGSIVLKLRHEHGGNEWVKKFYRHLSSGPPTVGLDSPAIQAQLLNFTIAASLASQEDPTKDFKDRWRFPFDPAMWAALKKVDWKKPGLTNDQVIDVLPSEQLLPSVVQVRPSFLTPERRLQNLLIAGDFEGDDARRWKRHSFRENKLSGAIEGVGAKVGQKSAVLRATISDDTHFNQMVSIQPNMRYLLSGWIKTRDVAIDTRADQTYRKAGATLAIWGGYEHSSSLTGTNDWQYVTLIFDANNRTEVSVGPRLGFWNSIASGEAWFDDLCLIPLGPSPVRPGAQTPPVAPSAPSTLVTNKDWKGWPKDAPAPAIAPFNAAQAKQHQEAWAKHLGVPVEYTNSVGMQFRLIPPGEYLRGSTPEDIAADFEAIDFWYSQFAPSCGPQHKVTVTQPFYLGVYEVTQEAYSRVMGNNPAHFTATGPGRAFVTGKDTSKHPVERVSWNDAVDFCTKLSANEKLQPCYSRVGDVVTLRTGNGYRLPTEAEWELACRAGTTTTFWNGNSADEYGQVGRNYANKSLAKTHPVGELKSNPFGLFDTHGNVWEYAQDSWSPMTYRQLASGKAIDPLYTPSGNSLRAIRGGSCMDVPTTSTSGTRLGHGPTGRSSHNIGFRAMLSVEAVKAALANPVQAEAPPVEISGKELRRFEGHQGPVWKAVFSADGKRVLSGSGFPNGDSTMRLWDVETGREIRQFRNEGANWVYGVALSHDGKQALSGNVVGITLWDVETGAVVRRMDFDSTNKKVLSVAFTPDGKRGVSAGSDHVVRLWDLASGTEIRTLTGHQGRVMSVAFSPDGSQIASCGLDEDKTVRLWNTETGKEMLRLEGHTAGVESVAFTPDGSRIVSSAFDGLILWDVKAGKLIRKIGGDGTGLLEAVFFPDGRRVLTGGNSGRVSIWDSETGQELQRLAEGSEWVWTVAVSPDGLRGVSAGGSNMINGQWLEGKDFAIRLWSLADINSSSK